MARDVRVSITVNDLPYERTVRANMLLAEFLRQECGLTGTHLGCHQGICGSCTVLVDGEPVKACLQLAVQAAGSSVTTIEGLAAAGGALHPIQAAFVEHGAVQCGFCIPGMIMTAKALLDATPRPTLEQIRSELANNLCRCTGYVKIVRAVQAAALVLAK